MPADPDDLEVALKALARREGKSRDELLKELLGDRIKTATEGKSTEMTRSGVGETREEAIKRHNANDFPGTAVVSYRQDPYGETPEEARERWLEEEAELIDGVHGFGGQSAGGIFGEGPISTSIYDPGAQQRAMGQMSGVGNLRLARVVERLEARLDQAEGRRALPGPARRRLGRGNR